MGLVLLIVLLSLSSLAPAVAGVADATRGRAVGRGTWIGGTRHVSCTLADALSLPRIGVYADAMEAAVRALGVDVPPHTFVRWVTRLGRVAARVCEEGDLR